MTRTRRQGGTARGQTLWGCATGCARTAVVWGREGGDAVSGGPRAARTRALQPPLCNVTPPPTDARTPRSACGPAPLFPPKQPPALSARRACSWHVIMVPAGIRYPASTSSSTSSRVTTGTTEYLRRRAAGGAGGCDGAVRATALSAGRGTALRMQAPCRACSLQASHVPHRQPHAAHAAPCRLGAVHTARIQAACRACSLPASRMRRAASLAQCLLEHCQRVGHVVRGAPCRRRVARPKHALPLLSHLRGAGQGGRTALHMCSAASAEGHATHCIH